MVYEVLDDNEVFDGVVLGDSVFCSRASSSSCYSSSSSSSYHRFGVLKSSYYSSSWCRV